jgi:hypothetical protein
MPNAAIQVVPIEQVKLNKQNPRLIKDARFEQLVQSLIDFPEMLHLRPIVVDEAFVALGGNMRLHAALRLDYKEVPIIMAMGLTEAQKREFVIKDNASFGEWDFEVLANEWSQEPLGAWGIDLPKDWLEEPDATSSGSGSGDSPDGEQESEFANRPIMTITFMSPEELQQAEIDVQELLDRKYPNAFFTVQVGERHA